MLLFSLSKPLSLIWPISRSTGPCHYFYFSKRFAALASFFDRFSTVCSLNKRGSTWEMTFLIVERADQLVAPWQPLTRAFPFTIFYFVPVVNWRVFASLLWTSTQTFAVFWCVNSKMHPRSCLEANSKGYGYLELI
jgi:hypothetical protein